MRRHAKTAIVGSTSATAKAAALLALAIAATLGIGAAPAQAVTGAAYSGTSFGPDGTPATSFARVQGVAVDQASEDVYVYEAAEGGRVYKFDSSGAPVNFSSTATNVIEEVGGAGNGENEIAVAPAGSPGGTAGDIYVANNNQVLIYSSAGTKIGQLSGGEACGVATDPAGNVFVGFYSNRVNKYTPIANPPTNGDKSGASEGVVSGICNVGADGLGNVYATRYNGGLQKLEGLGATSALSLDSSSSSLAIDPTTNDIYADQASGVAKYNSAGKLLVTFGQSGPGALSGSHGIAVNSSSGDIYVSSGAGKVEVFSPVEFATATTEAATAVKRTTATLHGTASADGGPAASCEFQYTTQASFQAEGFGGATSAPCSPAGPFTGSSAEAVSKEVSGLNVATSYRFRVVGTNANGANPGAALSFETLAAVNLTTGKASNLAPTTATLNGTVNPEGAELEECLFVYGEGLSAPCAETPAQIGTGEAPVAIHANVSGLTPNTEYQFHLKAKNSFGTSESASKSFTSFGPPRINTSFVSQVTTTSATVKGLINPDGEATTYVVQYVTETDFKASGYAKAIGVPAGGEAIGSDAVPVEVSQQLTGLTPLTTYYARIVAENDAGTKEGPDLVFTTYTEQEPGLSDGRAYEQVTPVDKNGAAPTGGPDEVQSAASGNGITYVSGGGIPGSEGSQQFSSYLASRGTDWSTQGLLPPASAGSVAEVFGWSEDLSQIYVSQASVPGSPRSFLQRESATHSTRVIATGIHGLNGGNAISYVGASADNTMVVFESGAVLPPGGATEAFNTYIWNKPSDELSLVGVFNNGLPPAEGSLAGSNTFLYHKHLNQAQHTVSSDGSRVFFTDAGSGQLYVRQNPAQPQSALDGAGHCTEAAMACTIRVSASQRAVPDPGGEKPAVFMTASPDGSKAFFTSSGKLTDDATTGPGDEGSDLYRYDLESGGLIDIAPDGADFNGAEVQGVLGASDDGSYVYFAANGVLATGATPGDCSGITATTSGSGACNLYLWHDGATVFIAPMKTAGSYEGADSANWISSNYSDNTARVTSNGQTLLFRALEKLTAYDSNGIPEFYRYSAQDGDLNCVSCSPTGIAPTNIAANTPTLRSIDQAFRSIGPAAFNTRNLSQSGDRVFFETREKLVASDTNGLKDAYEWEASGSGSCHGEAQNGGCLYLLSTGTSPEPSYLGDESASGDDAFIFTVQPLVGQDKDQIVDVYDARVGGGIASQNPPPPPVPCEGEACKGGAPAPPVTESPGSASFSGPGNQKATRHHKKQRHHKKRHHRKRHASRKHG